MKKLGTQIPELNRVQDFIEQSVEPMENSPLWNGVLLPATTLDPGAPVNVAHRLGRQPLGYFVVGRSSNATVWDSPSSIPSKFLALNTDALVTVKLWVF